MSVHQHLIDATAVERAAFLAIPILAEACETGVTREVYLDYLGQAYHHVRQTCPLLALAAARCGERDGRYRDALFAYVEEERGHETWILDDIAALGGDAALAAATPPRLPARLMVAWAHHAIERISPYALLGMVHVLEGMSVALALRAAGAIASRVGTGEGGGGFSYLSSHGGLDVEHVAFFRTLVDGIDDPAAHAAVVDTARVEYRLFGDLFRDVAARWEERSHAA